MTDAFAGIRVLDLSSSMAGAWCTRLLADYGADVVTVEPPGGHPLRRLAPFTPDGVSIPAMYVLANKRSCGLTLPADREALLDLVAASDIVVESFAPGQLDRVGLNLDAFEARRPGLILVSITPFGRTGLRSSWLGNDLTAYALSGWASVNGRAGREPLKGSGFTASFTAGTSAFGAAVAALCRREANGRGEHIDLAEAEALAHIFGRSVLKAQYEAQVPGRNAERHISATHPGPVQDGFFTLVLGRGSRFRDAMTVLGLSAFADDPALANLPRTQPLPDAVMARISETLRDRSKNELFEAFGEMRTIAGPVFTVEELASDPHLAERGFFRPPSNGPGGPRFPGAPFKMSSAPWSLRSSAPRAGQHDAAVRRDWRNPGVATSPRADARSGKGLLHGVRAIVLTQAWAGTYCTELLALAGADVIQIEARKRPDPWRFGYDAPMPAGLREVPSALHPWNCSGHYNSVNLNKRAITLDLETPEGIDIFRRLVPLASVVAENFSPRVMAHLGIDYDALKRLHPSLILCSLSAYGATGPYRDFIGNGGTMEPTSGMSSLLGYRDGPPLNSGAMYPDPVAGYYGFAGIVTALFHRQRTGEGQYIDVSMQESNATFIGDALLEFELTGALRARLGNRHQTFAPHGNYPTRGEERWVAIAAESEEQWLALCHVANRPGWAADARFRSLGARKANEEELNQLLEEWLAEVDRDEVVEALQRAGVAAAPVLHAEEVASDPGFQERGVVQPVNHPEAGEWMQMVMPYRLRDEPTRLTRPSPTLGEHSAQVLEELLGIGPDEYSELARRGVTGVGPPAESHNPINDA